MEQLNHNKKNSALVLGALGIVYGDLGTSPLYALRQVLPHVSPGTDNILGILSLVFWSLILSISTCYVSVFLRADNNGEGGILALLSLLRRKHKKLPRLLFFIGIMGAGLLLADGMLTPAISVISAIEGLEVISPHFSNYVVPISFTILLVLYLCQRFGTAKIGFAFGPILLIWFITIAALGAKAIYDYPHILQAVNPYYAFKFLYYGGWQAYLLLSGIFLVITGAEAMYTDLGHFGKTPIRIGWFGVVLPSLLLNYFGQGAYLLQNPHDPNAMANSFYALAPSWFLFPFIMLATLATIVASQAVISASFSLTKQAVLLNVFPRLTIIQTSEDEKGQIYVPVINYILALCTLLLVLLFQTSDALAAAYGMSVNLVMIIVATLVIFVSYKVWKWSISKIILAFSAFLLIDLAFLGANLHKIEQGAWIPLLVAILSSIIMITWEKGTNILHTSYYMNKKSLPNILNDLNNHKLHFLEELTAVFITDPNDKSGGSFLHFLELNHIMPKQVLIVSVIVEDVPHVPEKNQFALGTVAENIYLIKLHYGFMQRINIPKALLKGQTLGFFPFVVNIHDAVYLIEKIAINFVHTKHPRLFNWQRKLFAFLLTSSTFDIDFYHLPHDRTMAIGDYCKM
jgi:KUP system potassium uptake protein